MAQDQGEKKGKPKRPTPLKRDIQNKKRMMINKAFKSEVKTAVNALHAAIAKQENDSISSCLNTVYSLMDKGVKRGIFKKNKADRTKSRLTARAFAPAKK